MSYREKSQRGESPFARLYLCILFSLLFHACVLLYLTRVSGIHHAKSFVPPGITAYLNTNPKGLLKSRTGITSSVTQASGNPSFAPPATPPSPHPQQSLPLDNTLYHADELDSQPEVIGHIDLEIAFSGDKQQNGRIQFLMLVAGDGTALWTYVEFSDYPPETTEKVVTQFRQAAYKPATKDGQAVNSLIRIEVQQQLDSD